MFWDLGDLWVPDWNQGGKKGDKYQKNTPVSDGILVSFPRTPGPISIGSWEHMTLVFTKEHVQAGLRLRSTLVEQGSRVLILFFGKMSRCPKKVKT